MTLTAGIELLTKNKELEGKCAAVQDLRKFQEQYNRMVADGIVQKRPYSLAPVNVLGAAIPGQTRYRVTK